QIRQRIGNQQHLRAVDAPYRSPHLVYIAVVQFPYVRQPRPHKISVFLRGILQVPLHLSKRFVYHLQGVFPLLRVEMSRTGSVPHLPVRQLGKMEGETCSSRGILTQTFQRGETGNIERGSLTQFRSHRSKLTNFRDDFCRHAQWFLRLSSLRNLWLWCQDLGVDKVFVVGGQGV